MRSAKGKSKCLVIDVSSNYTTFGPVEKLKWKLMNHRKSYLEFNTYKVSKRIVELNDRGIDHGFDIKAAKEIVANKNLIKKYDKISNELDAYNLRIQERQAALEIAARTGNTEQIQLILKQGAVDDQNMANSQLVTASSTKLNSKFDNSISG